MPADTGMHTQLGFSPFKWTVIPPRHPDVSEGRAGSSPAVVPAVVRPPSPDWAGVADMGEALSLFLLCCHNK